MKKTLGPSWRAAKPMTKITASNVSISCPSSDSNMEDPARTVHSMSCYLGMHATNSPSAVFSGSARTGLYLLGDHEIVPKSRWHGEHYSSQTVITPSPFPSNVHPALHGRDLVPHHVGCVQSRACRPSRRPSRLYSRARTTLSLHHNMIGQQLTRPTCMPLAIPPSGSHIAVARLRGPGVDSDYSNLRESNLHCLSDPIIGS